VFGGDQEHLALADKTKQHRQEEEEENACECQEYLPLPFVLKIIFKMKLHYFNCPSTNFVMIFLILLLLFCFWTN
jgi:hypothetical protein